MKDLYQKYIKYKKKYLNLKHKGGLLINPDEELLTACIDNKSIYSPEICDKEFPCFNKDGKCTINSKYSKDLLKDNNQERIEKCNNSSKKSLYLPEVCGETFPCMSNNFKCYLDKKFIGKKYPQKVINLIFSEDSESLKFLKFESEIKTNLYDNLMYSQNFPIGQGGISEIYNIFNLKFKKLNTVLKLKKPNLNSTGAFAEEFKKIEKNDNDRMMDSLKIQVTLQENNRFINKIFDYGIYTITDNKDSNFGTSVYVILELLNGDLFYRLGQLNKNMYSFSEDDRNYIKGSYYIDNIKIFRNLMKNILMGLKLIHEVGYLHLDLKPENICFVEPFTENKSYNQEEENDVNSEIRIIDFDSLTEIGKDITPSNSRAGTPSYIEPIIKKSLRNFDPGSPRQQKYRESFDLYSIGKIMFTVLFVKNHPEEDNVTQWFENYMNSFEIMNFENNSSFKLKDKYPDLYEIIINLVSDEESRMTIDEILEKPFFKNEIKSDTIFKSIADDKSV